jgi:ribokinase
MSSNGSGRPGGKPSVIVFGQIARDLVLVVDEMPGPGRSAGVCQRREMLGGKGANQAVALAQLGMYPALAGVIGEDQVGQRLLAMTDVVRADAIQTELLANSAVSTAAEAGKIAADLIRQGPSLVALAVDGVGNLVAWPEDCVFLPLTKTPVADTTGAGDAFVAALVTALAQGAGPQRAARLAVAAAGATVGHPGGRPALTPKAIQNQLTLLPPGTRP